MVRGDGGSRLFITVYTCDACSRNFPTVGEAEDHERGCGGASSRGGNAAARGHFDMRPFFEWELKVLPIAVIWFERARSIEINGVGGVVTRQNSYPRRKTSVDKQKLSAIYQFIRAMPEVFEPVRVTAKRKRYLSFR